MKKVLCVILALALLCACGCEKKAAPSLDMEYIDLAVSLPGLTEEEVHEALGQPHSFLSGFRGDVYRLAEDGTLLIVYYGYDDLIVEHVKVT